jgi:mRNA interferase ChpB
MVRRVKFEQGDIVYVNLEPTVGHEQQGERPALVLSPASFNALGVVLVAPVTQGGGFARFAGFAVPLSGSGSRTQGVVLVNMVRAIDLEARGARKIERVAKEVIEDALARLRTIIE